MRNISKIIAAAALAASALPAAFASTGTTWVGGEAGFATHPTQSGLTRAQVRGEVEKFVRDGGTLSTGEVGHTQPRQRADNAATIGNAPSPSPAPVGSAAPALSSSERQELISGGN